MSLELRQLRYFVAVAEELHFGRAAARLRIAQPGLSQQIKRLERQLRVQLLVRDKLHVEMTPAGEVLLDHARVALEAADKALACTRAAAANGPPTASIPRYGHRSDPQIQVADRRMIASVGARIFGSSRSSTRTSPGACRTAPRMTFLLRFVSIEQTAAGHDRGVPAETCTGRASHRPGEGRTVGSRTTVGRSASS